jgi:hypothetical protein
MAFKLERTLFIQVLAEAFLYLQSELGSNIQYCDRNSCIVRILCILVLLRGVLFQARLRLMHFVSRWHCPLLHHLIRHLPIDVGTAQHCKVMSSISGRL